MVAAAAETPSTRLSPVAAAFVPRSLMPTADVVAACLNSTGHTPTPHTHHHWFHVVAGAFEFFLGEAPDMG